MVSLYVISIVIFQIMATKCLISHLRGKKTRMLENNLKEGKKGKKNTHWTGGTNKKHKI